MINLLRHMWHETCLATYLCCIVIQKLKSESCNICHSRGRRQWGRASTHQQSHLSHLSYLPNQTVTLACTARRNIRPDSMTRPHAGSSFLIEICLRLPDSTGLLSSYNPQLGGCPTMINVECVIWNPTDVGGLARPCSCAWMLLTPSLFR